MLDETGLWRDLTELPETLAATLDAHVGFSDVAAMLGAPGVRRVVASGNGAAYYVCLALWLASLEGRQGPEVLAVPSGLLARGAFAWRPGDVLLAVSSSGEFRDLIEAIDGGAPAPYAAVTSTPGSTIGSRAGACALVAVAHQRAVTHTQAFCGNVVAALGVWAKLTSDPALASALARLPEQVDDGSPGARGRGPPTAGAVEADERGRVRQRPRLGGGAGGGAAAQGGLGHSHRGRRDPRGGDLDDDGAAARRSRAEPADAGRRRAARRGGGGVRRAGRTRAPGARAQRPTIGGSRPSAPSPPPPCSAPRSASPAASMSTQPAWTDAYYRVARGPA